MTGKLKFQTYLDGSTEWRWRLKSANGRILADSGEGYKNYSECLAAIGIIKGGADDADID